MPNEEQLEILKRGVSVWNKWRNENPKTRIDLSGADLRNAYLHGARLDRANLIGANLVRANLYGVTLLEANLAGSKLGLTQIRNASLVEANLSGADLREACLINVYFFKANLEHARMGSTVLSNIDLSNTLGLEKVHHETSSSIGIDTFQASKGKLPISFLRGCGLSDLDIEYAKLANLSLDPEQVTNITYKIHHLYLGGGIQYYSCFISYSSKDHDFAQHLYDDLQNNGVRCWFDTEDLKIGDQIRPTIDRQIRLRDKLLVILSENSVKSEWVGGEVEGALEEESKGDRLVLFPIRLDDTVLNTRDDWAAKIKRRRHIGDFSNWKDKASYQKAFERLLRDLKASSDKSDKGASQ